MWAMLAEGSREVIQGCKSRPRHSFSALFRSERDAGVRPFNRTFTSIELRNC